MTTPAAGVDVGSEGQQRTAYLDRVVRLLWPPPAHIHPDEPAPEGRLLEDFVVFPGGNQPRLLVPRRPRRVAAQAALRYSQPVSTTARLRLLALSTAMRCGLAQRGGRPLRVSAPADAVTSTITDHLAEVLGHRVHVAIHVGPPRANRKPVLQVLHPSGRTVAYAKVGIDEPTRALVAAEAATLAELESRGLQALQTPAVLGRGGWGDLEVLVQQALPLTGRRSRVDAAGLAAAMVEVASPIQPAEPLTASTYWSRLRSSLTGPGDATERLADLLERLSSRLDIVVPFGSWHGDWTTWNMASRGSHLLVWDWERFERDVPAGFDALHYRFQSLKAQRGAAAAIRMVLAEADRLVAPFGVSGEAAAEVTVAYAIRLASRLALDAAALRGPTWGFTGSPTVGPLVDFADEWLRR